MVFPPISIHAPPRGATIAADTARLATFKFQFTPLREGRPFPVATRLSRSIDFNSRPSARGDALRVRSRWLLPVHFNSRPSARGDTPPQAARPGTADISIHAPPRGATSLNMRRNNTDGYFNSRPSARGDVGKVLSGVQSIISIHAPPRGATVSCCPIHIRANISIHAPPRGATLRANRHVVRLDDFNSRPSARGDTFFISRPCFIGLFQFTPLREGRQTPQKFFLRIILFQFTPLREGRHVSCGCFNGTIDISIHAPPRGATKRISVTLGTKAFQFTPLREGRPGA